MNDQGIKLYTLLLALYYMKQKMNTCLTKSQLNEVNDKIAFYTKKIENLKKGKTIVGEADYKIFIQECNGLKIEINELKKTVGKLQKENKLVKEHNRQFQRDLRQLQKENKLVEEHNGQFQSDLRKLQKENKLVKEHNRQFQRDLRQLQKENKSVKEHNGQIQRDLDTSQRDYTKLYEENKQAINDHTKLQNDFGELSEENTQVLDDYMKLFQKYDNIIKKNSIDTIVNNLYEKVSVDNCKNLFRNNNIHYDHNEVKEWISNNKDKVVKPVDYEAITNCFNIHGKLMNEEQKNYELGRLNAKKDINYDLAECDRLFTQIPFNDKEKFDEIKKMNLLSDTKEDWLKANKNDKSKAVYDNYLNVQKCANLYRKAVIDRSECDDVFKTEQVKLFDKNNIGDIKKWLFDNKGSIFYNKTKKCFGTYHPYKFNKDYVDVEKLDDILIEVKSLITNKNFALDCSKDPNILTQFTRFLRYADVGSKFLHVRDAQNKYKINTLEKSLTQSQVIDDVIQNVMIKCSEPNFGLDIYKINIGGTAFAYPLYVHYENGSSSTSPKGIYMVKMFMEPDSSSDVKLKTYQKAYRELDVVDKINTMDSKMLVHVSKIKTHGTYCEIPGNTLMNIGPLQVYCPKTNTYLDIQYKDFLKESCKVEIIEYANGESIKEQNTFFANLVKKIAYVYDDSRYDNINKQNNHDILEEKYIVTPNTSSNLFNLLRNTKKREQLPNSLLNNNIAKLCYTPFITSIKFEYTIGPKTFDVFVGNSELKEILSRYETIKTGFFKDKLITTTTTHKYIFPFDDTNKNAEIFIKYCSDKKIQNYLVYLDGNDFNNLVNFNGAIKLNYNGKEYENGDSNNGMLHINIICEKKRIDLKLGKDNKINNVYKFIKNLSIINDYKYIEHILNNSIDEKIKDILETVYFSINCKNINTVHKNLETITSNTDSYLNYLNEINKKFSINDTINIELGEINNGLIELYENNIWYVPIKELQKKYQSLLKIRDTIKESLNLLDDDDTKKLFTLENITGSSVNNPDNNFMLFDNKKFPEFVKERFPNSETTIYDKYGYVLDKVTELIHDMSSSEIVDNDFKSKTFDNHKIIAEWLLYDNTKTSAMDAQFLDFKKYMNKYKQIQKNTNVIINVLTKIESFSLLMKSIDYYKKLDLQFPTTQQITYGKLLIIIEDFIKKAKDITNLYTSDNLFASMTLKTVSNMYQIAKTSTTESNIIFGGDSSGPPPPPPPPPQDTFGPEQIIITRLSKKEVDDMIINYETIKLKKLNITKELEDVVNKFGDINDALKCENTLMSFKDNNNKYKILVDLYNILGKESFKQLYTSFNKQINDYLQNEIIRYTDTLKFTDINTKKYNIMICNFNSSNSDMYVSCIDKRSIQYISMDKRKDIIEIKGLNMKDEKRIRFCNEYDIYKQKYTVKFLLMEYLNSGSYCDILNKVTEIGDIQIIHTIFQVMLQIEYMKEQKLFYHGDLHINNIMFAIDKHYTEGEQKWYKYTFVDYAGIKKDLYIPIYKIIPKIIDFDKSMFIDETQRAVKTIIQSMQNVKYRMFEIYTKKETTNTPKMKELKATKLEEWKREQHGNVSYAELLKKDMEIEDQMKKSLNEAGLLEHNFELLVNASNLQDFLQAVIGEFNMFEITYFDAASKEIYGGYSIINPNVRKYKDVVLYQHDDNNKAVTINNNFNKSSHDGMLTSDNGKLLDVRGMYANKDTNRYEISFENVCKLFTKIFNELLGKIIIFITSTIAKIESVQIYDDTKIQILNDYAVTLKEKYNEIISEVAKHNGLLPEIHRKLNEELSSQHKQLFLFNTAIYQIFIDSKMYETMCSQYLQTDEFKALLMFIFDFENLETSYSQFIKHQIIVSPGDSILFMSSLYASLFKDHTKENSKCNLKNVIPSKSIISPNYISDYIDNKLSLEQYCRLDKDVQDKRNLLKSFVQCSAYCIDLVGATISYVGVANTFFAGNGYVGDLEKIIYKDDQVVFSQKKYDFVKKTKDDTGTKDRGYLQLNSFSTFIFLMDDVITKLDMYKKPTSTNIIPCFELTGTGWKNIEKKK